MTGRGPQVLADGDDLRAHGGQIGQGGLHLVGLLPHAHDQARLGHQPGPGRPGQHGEAAGVAGRGSHRPLETGHRLDVVVEHVGPNLTDPGQGLGRPLEVGDQHLHPRGRAPAADGLHRAGHEVGPAVGQVVAGHHGEHGMVEAQVIDGLGHPVGLGGVGRERLRGVDGAETAGPGAALAEQHERGRALVPALVDVGAARFLAHRHQVELAGEALQLPVPGVGPHLGLHPRRLALGQVHPVAHPGPVEPGAQPNRHPTPAARARRLRNRVGGGGGQIRGPSGPGGPGREGGGIGGGEAGPVVGGGQLHRPAGGQETGGVAGHHLGHLGHGGRDPLGRQRGHTLVGDPAGHDVVEPAQVDVDVEGEAVHGSGPGHAHPDGGQLSGPPASPIRPGVTTGVEPHPGIAGQPPRLQAQFGHGVDQHLLHRADPGPGVGQTSSPLAGHGHHRIADQLARPVEGDVATPVHPEQLGPHRGRIHQDVGLVGPHPEGVDRRVLAQQEMIVDAGEQGLLEVPGLGVGNGAEPPHPQWPGPFRRARPPSHGSR